MSLRRVVQASTGHEVPAPSQRDDVGRRATTGTTRRQNRRRTRGGLRSIAARGLQVEFHNGRCGTTRNKDQNTGPPTGKSSHGCVARLKFNT